MKDKMLYAATRASMKRVFGDNRVATEVIPLPSPLLSSLLLSPPLPSSNEGAVKDKMLYAATRASMKRVFGDNRVATKVFLLFYYFLNFKFFL